MDEQMNDGVDGEEPAKTQAETPEPESRPERQAARYRRKLRDAEAQRDAALSMLEAARRSIILNHPAMNKVIESARPDVIAGIDAESLERMFGENGKPDDEAITAHVRNLLSAKPYMASAGRPTQATRHIIDGAKGEGTFRIQRDPLAQALRK